MKRVTIFFSERLLSRDECGWKYFSTSVISQMVVVFFEYSIITINRHSSQRSLQLVDPQIGPRQRTITITRGTSASLTATRTTTTRITQTLFVA